ncbi:MAG: hypothetical protein DRP29_00215 [Thermodesulfobacteriota bacterium]|nr:MAG: hypothetical protein DRP29_00215 [Thermodesulfobacteriota bacterium]
MKNKGYTLIEILLVIGILLLLTTFMVSIYKNFLETHTRERTGIKQEMNLNTFLIYLQRLISSTGFGFPIDELKTVNVECDTTLESFAYTSGVVGVAKNCDGNDKLYFKSLALSDTRFSGCWWYVDNGKIITQAVDKLGASCPNSTTEFDNDDTCLILDLNQVLKNNEAIECEDAFSDSGLVFYYSNEGITIYPSSVCAGMIYLTPTYNEKCAPGSYKLLLRYSDSPSRTLYQCVGGLKIDDSQLPYRIKVCLLVQLSGRTSIAEDVPSQSSCGNFTSIPSEWKFYRWRVIEKIISFKNLSGIK